MAKDSQGAERLIDSGGLARALHLTQELATAITRGDLDEALRLLEARRLILRGLRWPKTGPPELMAQLGRLRDLESQILSFCRLWREVLAERLKILHDARMARLGYRQKPERGRFIQVDE